MPIMLVGDWPCVVLKDGQLVTRKSAFHRLSVPRQEFELRRGSEMKRNGEAHWVKDGAFVTLHVRGKMRADADTEFNVGIMRSRSGMFRKERLVPVFANIGAGIIETIEEKVGIGEVPILDKRGEELPWARVELSGRARRFQELTVRSPHNPIVEAEQAIKNVVQALEGLVRERGLDAHYAEARKHCEAASAELATGRFTNEAASATLAAANTLARIRVGEASARQKFFLNEAKDACRHAAGLAALYGEGRDVADQPPEMETGLGQTLASERELRLAKVTITKGNPANDLSLRGHVTRSPGYAFTAKLAEPGSSVGEGNSRIEKLEVRHEGKSSRATTADG